MGLSCVSPAKYLILNGKWQCAVWLRAFTPTNLCDLTSFDCRQAGQDCNYRGRDCVERRSVKEGGLDDGGWVLFRRAIKIIGEGLRALMVKYWRSTEALILAK